MMQVIPQNEVIIPAGFLFLLIIFIEIRLKPLSYKSPFHPFVHQAGCCDQLHGPCRLTGHLLSCLYDVKP